eukprot:scaffold381942_cov27-Prasinocladus_malaysianus.AAC.1
MSSCTYEMIYIINTKQAYIDERLRAASPRTPRSLGRLELARCMRGVLEVVSLGSASIIVSLPLADARNAQH